MLDKSSDVQYGLDSIQVKLPYGNMQSSETVSSTAIKMMSSGVLERANTTLEKHHRTASMRYYDELFRRDHHTGDITLAVAKLGEKYSCYMC